MSKKTGLAILEKRLPKEWLAEKGRLYEIELDGLEIGEIWPAIEEAKRLKAAVNDLGLACEELMKEYVSKKGGADWELINGAISEGNALVGRFKKKRK